MVELINPPCLEVAVGIIVDSRQQVLISQRLPHASSGGLWEFPGGKIEKGESPEEALVRELQEEVALTVTDTEFFMAMQHHYGDRQVSLSFYFIRKYRGEPKANEGQPIQWRPIARLHELPFCEPNKAVIQRLQAPCKR